MSETARQYYGVAIVFVFLLILEIGLFNFLKISTDVSAASAPIVWSVKITSVWGGNHETSLNLNAGTSKTIYVQGTLYDADGYADIATVELLFNRSGTGTSCIEDKNYCYRVASCITSDDPTNNVVYYSCEPLIWYFADATDAGTYVDNYWNGWIQVYDAAGNTGWSVATTEINSLVAGSSAKALNFGNLDIGNTNPINDYLQLYNDGNRELGTSFDMPVDMSCTTGSIPATAIKFDESDVFYDGMLYTLSNTPATITTINPVRTGELYVNAIYNYWNIKPPMGAGGSCSGTLNINTFLP